MLNLAYLDHLMHINLKTSHLIKLILKLGLSCFLESVYVWRLAGIRASFI